MGNVEVARDPEGRQLLAQLKRTEQELDILKKPWSSLANRTGEHLLLHHSVAGLSARASYLPSAARVG